MRYRPCTLPLLPCPLSKSLHLHPRRTFSDAPQTITANRLLRFSAASLFGLIADINAYPEFLPYCLSARVLSLSDPDPHSQTRWPRTADLHVGFGGIVDEVFRSKVYCVPNRLLEAVVGVGVRTTIPRGELPHYYYHGESPKRGVEENDGLVREGDRETAGSGLIRSLRARWTFQQRMNGREAAELRDFSKHSLEEGQAEVSTAVGLDVEVQFGGNPLYAVLAEGILDQVTRVMIDAFEKRAKEVLRKENSTGKLEGDGVKDVS